MTVLGEGIRRQGRMGEQKKKKKSEHDGQDTMDVHPLTLIMPV